MLSVDEQGNQVLPGREIAVTDMGMGELETSNHRMQDIEGMVHHRRTISDKSAINVQVELSTSSGMMGQDGGMGKLDPTNTSSFNSVHLVHTKVSSKNIDVIAQMKPEHQESYVLPFNGLMIQHGSICKQDCTKYKLVGSIVHTLHESGSSTRVTNICVIEQSKIDVAPAGGGSVRGPSLMADYGGIGKLEINDLLNHDHGDMVQQIVSADQDAVKARAWPNVVEHGKLDMAPLEGDSMRSPTMLVENGGIGRQETLDIDKQDADNKVNQIVTDQGVAMARKGSSVDDKNKLDVHSWGGSGLPGSVLNGKDGCIGKQETSYKQNLGFGNMFQNRLPLVARMKNVALGNIPRYYNFHKNASHNHAGYHKQVKSEMGNMTPVKLKKGTILASYISALEDDKEKNLEKQNEMDEVEASSCMDGEVTIQQAPEDQKSAFYLTSDKAPLAENGQKFTGRNGRKDNS